MLRFRSLQIVLVSLACLTLAVGACAVWAEYDSFPPHLRGFGEVTRRGEVAGWAVDASDPAARVEVEVFVDGRFAGHAVASLPRPDVLAAGRARDENCGYLVPLPTALPAGAHVAKIYALRAPGPAELRTLRQLGDALNFSTDADGRVTAAASR